MTSPAPALPAAGTTRVLRVAERVTEARDVVSLLLVDPRGGELPPWTPGAHVDVLVAPGTLRQCSLCGDPGRTDRWRLGVLRDAAGRGGSMRLHDEIGPGSLLEVSAPRNNFALVEAPSYLLVAGGIGVTPLLAMARELDRRGAEWRLVYAGRSADRMAYTDELTTIGSGGRVVLHRDDESGPVPLGEHLGGLAAGTAVYCCGPEGLLDAVEAACPAGCALHVERFAPRPVTIDPDADEPFEVLVRSTGRTVQVAAGQSILDALAGSGVDVPSSCREGTCGSCETAVIDGSVEHRDSLLSEEEQQAGDTMMICVSRAGSPRLVLDL